MDKQKAKFRYKFEIILLIAGLLLSAAFNSVYGNIMKPVVVTLIFISLSLGYKLLFKTVGAGAGRDREDLQGKAGDKVDNLVSSINEILKVIKEKSKDDSKFMIVSKYLTEIHEFEKVIPILYEGYKKGKQLVLSNRNVYCEMAEIEERVKTAEGGARTVYEMTLEEKKKTLKEIEGVKANTDEIESKLYYIYTIIQKIETTIESSHIGDKLTDRDVTELSTQLEVFSDSVKDIVKSVKI